MHINLTPTAIVAVVICAVALVVLIVLLSRQQQKVALRRRFGREYDRAVREHGSEAAAQAALDARQKRVASFKIRSLTSPERDRYAEHWRIVQSRFVDDPRDAVIEADDTVTSLMAVRGYPMADFEQRAADLSVDHPNVISNYRAARAIAVRHRQGQASTEDLRQAMIYYRSLFEELLEQPRSRGVSEAA